MQMKEKNDINSCILCIFTCARMINLINEYINIRLQQKQTHYNYFFKRNMISHITLKCFYETPKLQHAFNRMNNTS